MAEVDQVQASREMVDSVIVHLYLIVAPAPRVSGASLLESLDDCEVDPFQILSLARQRHHQSVDVMEVRQRAVGSPWDGEARALRCLPIHPYDKIHHYKEGDVQLGVAMLAAYICGVASWQARRERCERYAGVPMGHRSGRDLWLPRARVSSEPEGLALLSDAVSARLVVPLYEEELEVAG